MREYIPRVADEVLADRLESKGAVLIQGAKWCGKTTTAKHAAASFVALDQPDRAVQYRQVAELNPQLLLRGEVPRLLDEWQLVPNLWNAVRYEVDQRDDFGQFILTGSAVPPRLDASAHSGTGRIARFTMRPMTLWESGESNGEVSLTDLFSGLSPQGASDTDLETMAFLTCRGGWPRAVGVGERVALRQAFDYFDAIVNQDIGRVDDVVRDPQRTALLLRSYARHVATPATLATIRKDVLANSIETFDQNTLYAYLSALCQIFVLEDLPAWNPNLRSKTAIRSTATRYFTDPSIAVAALGATPSDLVADLNTFGMFFENLCIRDLRVFAEALDGSLYHFRDANGLECDAVMRLRNGSYGLIEVKLGGDSLIEEGAKSLLKLEAKIDTTRMKAPAFKMVLCAVAPFAYQRPDGVNVVPLSCLKP